MTATTVRKCDRRAHIHTYCLCHFCKILLGEAEGVCVGGVLGNGTVMEKDAWFLRWTLIICPASGSFTKAEALQA